MTISLSNELVINVKVIDEQHQHLIDLVNEFYQSSTSDGIGNACYEFGDDILNYMKAHFACEEDLMRKHRYDQLVHHEEEHDKLLYTSILMLAFPDEEENTPAQFFMLFKDWIENHIKTAGKPLGAYLNEMGMA